MKRGIGSRVGRWLAVAAMCALPVQGFAFTVNTNDIVNSAVTTPKIADMAVTTQKIADGAVTSAKLGFSCGSGQMLLFNGSAWVCSAGIAGPQGVKGDKGDKGDPGIQGIQGVKGDKGDPGIQGMQGVKGDKGDKGDIGLTGAQGLPGEQGVKGDKGDKGDTGATGPAAHYANVIVVAKSGGDYTDLVEAANYANTVATANNPYLIKVMPGIYDVQQAVFLKGYVNLEGSGAKATIIRGTNLSQGVVYTGGGMTISNIRIESYGDTSILANYALSVRGPYDTYWEILDCNVINVELVAQGNSYFNVALHNSSSKLIGNNIRAFATDTCTNYCNAFGAWVSDSESEITNSVAIGKSVNGVGIGLKVQTVVYSVGSTRPSPIFNGLVAEGTNYGFMNDHNFYSPRIRNSRFTGTDAALATAGGSYDTLTYISNSELNGPVTLSGGGGGANTANFCAGITDTNGVFYANSCP